MFKKKPFSAKTPQPPKAGKKNFLVNSAPPAKRKQLNEEIDEEISDKEFDNNLETMKNTKKDNKLKAGGRKRPAADSSEEEELEDYNDSDEDESDDDDDNSDQVEKDSDDDDEDDDDDDDIEMATPPPSNGKKVKKNINNNVGSTNKKEESRKSKKIQQVEAKNKKDDEADDESDDEVTATPPAKKTKLQNDGKKKENKKKEVIKPVVNAKLLEQDQKVKEERDKRTLFMKGFQSSVTLEDIKGLSTDIQAVRIFSLKGKNLALKRAAYMDFRDEKTAVANYKKLKNAEINGQKITMDYVGAKRQNGAKNMEVVANNKNKNNITFCSNKLFIGGFGSNFDENDLKKIFPKAGNVLFNGGKVDSTKMYAILTYKNEKECMEDHESKQGYIHKGCELFVQFARQKKIRKKNLKKGEGVKERVSSKQNGKTKEKSPATTDEEAPKKKKKKNLKKKGDE